MKFFHGMDRWDRHGFWMVVLSVLAVFGTLFITIPTARIFVEPWAYRYGEDVGRWLTHLWSLTPVIVLAVYGAVGWIWADYMTRKDKWLEEQKKANQARVPPGHGMTMDAS